jgi:DNA-binding LacI/PurR family transcriptional regulator
MPVGIDDVARAAGVSTATVSRALGGRPDVSASTRQRVQAIAVQLGYAPTPSAVSLASGRTRTIALLTPWVSRWFHSNVIEGACRSLRVAGFGALLNSFEVHEDATRPPVNLDVLRRRVDGVLVAGMTMSPGEVGMLESLRVPLVYVGSGPPDQVLVHIDDVATARRATEHLLALGHTRIGHISGYPTEPTPWASEVERATGYAEALRGAGLEPETDLMAYGRFARPGGRASAAELLDRVPDLSAVVADSDEMAFGVLDVLRERGLRAPDDLSVIGIDGHPLGDLVGLTTLAQDAIGLGETAARLLLEMIGGATVEQQVVFPTTLLARGTTRPARTPAGERES